MGNRMRSAVGADSVAVGINQGLRLVWLSLIIFATLGAAACGGGCARHAHFRHAHFRCDQWRNRLW